MAFKLRTWLIAALGGCALVALAYLPPAEHEFSARRVGSTSLSRLRSHLQRAYIDLHRLQVKDSVLSLANEAPAYSQGIPVLILDPGLGPETRANVERALKEPLKALEPLAPDVALAVAIVVDTVPPARGGPILGGGRTRYFLPRSTDGTACISVISLSAPDAAELRRALTWYSRAKPDTVGALLGPCGYYRAFGRPGRHVEQWLDGHDYVVAQRLEWATGGPPLRSDAGDDHLVGRWWSTLHGCAAGNRSVCRAAVLQEDRASRGGPSGVARFRYWAFFSRNLGPNAGRFLSDVIAEYGRDRFALFWSSEEPVETAFAAAMGTTLEDWTMKWSRAQVGDVRTGPAPSGSATMLALLLSAALVGATAVIARRRQVS
jgi:hypothetical protein